MSLITLPSEILLEIIAPLPLITQHSLLLTHRRFYPLITPLAPTPKELHAFHLHKERADRLNLRHACVACILLLPFYHFSTRHTLPGTRSSARQCIACHTATYAKNLQPTNWILGSSYTRCAVFDQAVMARVHRPSEMRPVYYSRILRRSGRFPPMCAEVCFWGVEGPGGRDTVLCAGLMEGMTEGEKRVELERGGFLVQRLVERLDAVCRGREEVLKKVKMECMKARKESKTVAGEDPVGDLVRRLEEEEAALV